MDGSDSALAMGGLSAEGSAAGPPLKIFINYRHQDAAFAASTLYREFKGRFGQENIFFDEGAIRPGMPFLEEITSHLASTPGVFIAVIGPLWLSILDEHQRRNDDDYVVQEIDLALQNRWVIIPVLVDNAGLPSAPKLPRSIRKLPDRRVAYLRQTSLDSDLQDLSARLSEIHADMNIADGLPLEANGASEAAVKIAADGASEAGALEAAVRTAAVTEPPDVESTEVPVPELFPVDEDHYRAVVDEAYHNNLVIFLGAGVNAADCTRPFRPGAPMLPDDTDLARYLAAMARLESTQLELAEVAQWVRNVSGEPNVYKWAKQILRSDPAPGPVQTYLARLPKRLKQLGLEKRYQMIVTPKFDVALERAFQQADEPYDVAVYMAPRTEHAGRFVHLPWESVDPKPVLTNEYDKFPMVGDEGELTRTVFVRINGAVDDSKAGYNWDKNFVITEDHYIDYLRGRSAEQVVPMQILAKLRQASCLFLGYAIADWRLRVFLHWIWQDDSFDGAKFWAVEQNPDLRERQFWQRFGVSLYSCRLTDYIRGFDKYLEKYRDERD